MTEPERCAFLVRSLWDQYRCHLPEDSFIHDPGNPGFLHDYVPPTGVRP